ncbi:MAG: MotA/TolQ/ExbB proton channel family protein [Planctomycetota bacterium]|jgi:biopolymer transport protein ExbB
MRRTLAVLALVLSVALPASRALAAPAPDEVDERVMVGADLTLPELFRAGGGFSYVMIALSMAAAAAAVYCAIECRGGRVAPGGERAGVMELIAAGDRAGAVSALEGAPSLYARGVRAALSMKDASPEEARALLRASGEHDAAVLRGRLAMLPRIAAVSALVGVLGTLVGMHQAFGVAAMEVYRPLYAYAAVFKGLVLSVFGVGLAAVALAVYYVLVGRLERALAEAAYAFEEVALSLRRATPAKGGAGSAADARPASITPPPAAGAP